MLAGRRQHASATRKRLLFDLEVQRTKLTAVLTPEGFVIILKVAKVVYPNSL